MKNYSENKKENKEQSNVYLQIQELEINIQDSLFKSNAQPVLNNKAGQSHLYRKS